MDLFGRLQALDKLHVLGDVALGVGQLVQDIVLEFFDLNGKIVLLLDQVLG